MWKSKMRSLNIERAPKLYILFIGVRPLPKAKHVYLSAHELPDLLEIQYLLLRWHKVQNLLCLKNVKMLGLGIDLGNSVHRAAIKDILKVLNDLQDLKIWRMDEATLSEGFDVVLDRPFNDFGEITCVRFQLKTFKIEDFQGGKVELAIAGAVVKHAMCLRKVKVYICSHPTEHIVRKAIKALNKIECASPMCSFQVFKAKDMMKNKQHFGWT